MSGVNIEYKGESIATIHDTGSKTIKTQGKYCEGDILVEYEAPPTPLESKTVTPKTEQQTIVPQSPAIGFSEVTVEPVTPSIDPDIQPENIKHGVDILGVQGALKPPMLIEKTITENGTYTAEDDNADGFSEVEVGVPDNFTKYLDKTIEEVNSEVSGALSLSFKNCNLLKTVYLPNVTSMSLDYSSLYLFKGCNNLERINMGSYINIPNFWLQNNSSVKEVIITGAQTIGQYAFENCVNLVIRDLPSQVSSIGDSAFNGCIKIPYLDMSNLQQIPTLGSDVFSGTTFPFYFRDQQQLEEYSTATNWSTYADRFQIKEAVS